MMLRQRSLFPLLSVLTLWGYGSPPAAAEEVIRLSDRTIAFGAVVNQKGFEAHPTMAGYHAIVWKGGKAAGAALFQAEVTDLQVLEALEAIGGVPGNALGLDTWEERHHPENPAPDRIITGSPLDIWVKLPHRDELRPLAVLLEDPGAQGILMRLGGHRANIPHWKSGCISCLYSCPGSKVGNARYTVRDFVNGKTRFRVKAHTLPPDGTRVQIQLRLRDQG